MSEKRKRILNLLEEGHITAEEADRLLETLDEEDGDDKKEDNYFHSDFKKDVRSFTAGVKNFLDDTFNRIKDGPFEFNFSHMNVRREYEFSANDVDYFHFDLASTSIEILPEISNKIRIECRAKVFKETDQAKAEKLFNRNVEINVEQNTLHVESPNKHIQTELVIYLPKKQYDKASFNSVNGSIKIRSAQFNQASVSTVNGSIQISDYVGDAFYVETKHGSIKLDDVQLSKAKLSTSAGSVYVDGNVEQLNIDVVTGSVRSYIRNVAAKMVHIQSVTGSVQLYVPNNAPLVGTASTTVSSVDIQLENIKKHHLDEQITKKLVQFSNTEGQDYLDIDLSTKTGSIRVYPLS